MIHADRFALGTIVDEDGNTDEKKITERRLETPSGSLRFSMRSRMDENNWLTRAARHLPS